MINKIAVCVLIAYVPLVYAGSFGTDGQSKPIFTVATSQSVTALTVELRDTEDLEKELMSVSGRQITAAKIAIREGQRREEQAHTKLALENSLQLLSDIAVRIKNSQEYKASVPEQPTLPQKSQPIFYPPLYLHIFQQVNANLVCRARVPVGQFR